MFSWRYWLRRRLHVSVFIGLVATGLLVGIALSPVIASDFSGLSWLIGGIIFLTSVFVFRRVWMISLALLAGFIIGLWRGDSQLVKIQGYKNYSGQTVRLEGTITEDVGQGKHDDAQIELGNVVIAGHKLPEKVWLSLHTNSNLKRSDTLTIEGKLKPGFGNFAASMSFGKIIHHTKGVDQARDTRDWFAGVIRKVINEPEASLGLGFLVGQRSTLPQELDTQLQVVGLTHIVVASGYNLTVLVRLARRLLARVSKYLVAMTSSIMIGGFVLVTGLSPSMSRAGLVSGLSLAAWYYGRKVSPFILLPLVAAMTLLVNPSFAWGDVGWYLSFAAFGGVMIIAPLFHHYFFGHTKPGFVRQTLGETFAALLMTAPIIMLVFGQYSSYALLSNLLVVPVIPYIMLAVFMGGVISIVMPFIGVVANLPASGLLHYVTTVVQWIASFPGAQVDVVLTPIGLGLYYLGLVLVATYLWRKTRHNFRDDNIIE